MRRIVAATLAALIVLSGGLFAEEIKGKVKSVDADKGVITVTVGDKDQEFKVTNETKIVNPAGKDVPEGLKGRIFQRPGVQVTVTTEKKDDKEIVKEVKVGPAIAIKPVKPIQVKPLPIKPGQVKPLPVQPKPMIPGAQPLPVVPEKKPGEEQKKDT